MLSEKLSRCPSARWADCCAQSFSRGRRNNAIRSLFVSSKRLINIGRLLDALVLSNYPPVVCTMRESFLSSANFRLVSNFSTILRQSACLTEYEGERFLPEFTLS